ncbi:family 16 glycoside hydrolase [Polaribacter sp. M15]
MRKLMLLCSIVLLITSCKEEIPANFTQAAVKKEKKKEAKTYLPFTHIELNDLSGFKPTGENWKIVGDVIADRTKRKTITSTKGSGILLNTNDAEKNKNLFTPFEHGDIELELDVMVPKGSNSGLYFQSRYEVQIFDSWNVKEPKYKDMGAIYQRWDKIAPKGKEGYEGYPPRVNAAKAPGLWQHLKVIFHAAKFNKSGKKIKNAWFEEVWLNGVLVQENIELSGPTRGGGTNANEKPRGPLMIQGDHGPVAFKNIKYKLYEGNKFTLTNLKRTEYKSPGNKVDNLADLTKVKESKTKTFSIIDVSSKRDRKLVVYQGTLSIPKTGKYLFEGHSSAPSEVYIDNKKVMRIAGGMDKGHFKFLTLKKGKVAFKFIYNQHAPWARGCNLHVEGPDMQRYSLLEGVKKGDGEFDPLKGIIIEPIDKPRLQRSFVDHKGEKFTHCISVGTPQGVHYSYNLATGSLLKVWSGSFLNTTHMWLSRGFKQAGEPVGFKISMHRNLEFATLTDINTLWPDPLPENKGFRQLGYELDDTRMPAFSYQLGSTKITNKFTIPKGSRQLHKSIQITKAKNLWHKIADGESIKTLPNDIYLINNEGFYIDFSGNDLKPIIRNIDGKDELLIEIPNGNHTINYSIIW